MLYILIPKMSKDLMDDDIETAKQVYQYNQF